MEGGWEQATELSMIVLVPILGPGKAFLEK